MLTNLSLSDLIALRQLCFDESLGFVQDANGVMNARDVDSKWHDRFKLCDKELSERVEKIFEG
jgi:hypothetical protein